MLASARPRSAVMTSAALALLVLAVAAAFALAPLEPNAWPVVLLPAVVVVWWRWAKRLDRFESALRESSTRQDALLAGDPTAVVAVDRAGKIVTFNAAAERLFRLSRASVLGSSVDDLLSPTSRRHKMAKLRARFASIRGPAVHRIELSARRVDGRDFPAEVTLIRSATLSGPVIICFVGDLSDREQVERRTSRK